MEATTDTPGAARMLRCSVRTVWQLVSARVLLPLHGARPTKFETAQIESLARIFRPAKRATRRRRKNRLP